MIARPLCALGILLAAAAVGCDDSGSSQNEAPVPQALPLTDPRHVRALRALGIRNADSGGSGSPAFECGRDDSWINSTAFRGINAEGRKVEGVICCGWMKGCTVRF